MTNLTDQQEKQIKKIIESAIKNFEDEIKNLKSEVAECVKENKQLKSKIAEMEKSKETNSDIKETLWSKVVSGAAKKTNDQLSLLFETTKERKEQERKETNVIIYGLEPDKNDKVQVNNLLNAIESDGTRVRSIRRLKSKGIIDPLLIELEDVNSKNMVLKASIRLRKIEEYANVFIGRDLTASQRFILKKNLIERNEKNASRSEEEKIKFHYGIRNDNLTRIFHK
jgi:hypothetical protein